MKIYFAGNLLLKEREQMLFSANRLFSYYWIKEDAMGHKDFLIRIGAEGVLNNENKQK